MVIFNRYVSHSQRVPSGVDDTHGETPVVSGLEECFEMQCDPNWFDVDGKIQPLGVGMGESLLEVCRQYRDEFEQEI